ncbi:MAG: rRNA maturation protein [Archaeoglobaceae archaeon]
MRAMILTTSRKPSRKTRSFAKALSRFLNWQYVQRGKISLKEFENECICMISEIKGNPAFLNFYEYGEKVLEVFFSVSNIKKVKIDRGEVIYFGTNYNFFRALPASLLEKFDKRPYFPKKIVEKGNELVFCIGEEPIFKIKVLSVRRFDQNL